MPSIRLIDLPTFTDARGALTVADAGEGREGGEGGEELPFVPLRVRWIHGVPPAARRGGHAHRRTEQLFVALAGRVGLVADDGRTRRTLTLDSPARGLYTPPMTWVETAEFSPGAVCLLLSSTRFDEADYVRSYEDFLREVRP